MKKEMSRWGVGPIFAALSVMYGFITFIISLYFYPFLKIRFIQDQILMILGIILVVIGVTFLIISVKTVYKAYNSDKLVTTGVYKFCRHPLYASWVIFIVPGVVLLFNSWIGLTTPIFMYVILRILVKKEEIYLERRFGIQYLEYKKKVPCIFPYGSLFRSKCDLENA